MRKYDNEKINKKYEQFHAKIKKLNILTPDKAPIHYMKKQINGEIQYVKFKHN